MEKRQKEERDRLLEAAKASNNETVKEALDKLLFTVALAHDEEFIQWASVGTYSSGCTVTIPAIEHATTLQLAWNDEKLQIFAMEFCVETLEYGHLFDERTPMPGVILRKDLNT